MLEKEKVNFAAGGATTPADTALMMQMDMEYLVVYSRVQIQIRALRSIELLSNKVKAHSMTWGIEPLKWGKRT